MYPKPNKRLKKALIDAGLSQRELAEVVGMGESRISQVFNGHLLISRDMQSKIAAALKKRAKELFDVAH